MPLSIGTSAVRLAAFDGSGNQGGSHDMGRIGHPVEEFLTACFESVSGHRSVRSAGLISSIHDKIISHGVKKVYSVVGEISSFMQ